MEEGKDYLLRPHPAPQWEDHWVVILQNDPYKRVTLDFSNITIAAKEEGRTDRDLTYTYRVLHTPKEAPYLDTDEFEDYVSNVLRHVLETHEEKNANVYVSTETGEIVSTDN